MEDIYEDIEFIVGAKGIMTHQIPNAMRALEDWLREKVTEPRFWDGKLDMCHVGETEIQPMTGAERDAFWKRYGALPHPFSQFEGDSK